MVAAPPAPAHPWGLLALVAAARVAMGVQFQAAGALGPALLEAGLVPDYAALGTLIGAYSLAGVAVALPSGWLMARVGDRRSLLAGLGLMTLGGLALAAAPGFGAALAARLVAGVGATLLSTVCVKLVLDRFPAGPTLTTAMGIMLTAWPFGIGLALAVLPLFGGAWRWALLASALLCAVALPPLLRAVPSRARPHAPAAATAGDPRLRPGEWPPLLAVGLLWATNNAGFAVALGFAPAFLVTARGMDPAAAGALASLIGWAVLPLLPFGGAVAERSGRPNLVVAACTLGMAAALAGLATGALPPAAALLAFGLLAGLPPSLIMALLGRVLSPGSRAFGLGVHYTMFYAGLAGVPPLAGWVRDATGSAAAPLWVAVAAFVLSLAALGVVAGLVRRGRTSGVVRA